LLIKHRAYVGFRGSGLAIGNIEFPTGQSSATERLRMGYGGLMLGYTLPAGPVLDFALDVVMGSGGVRSRNEDGSRKWDPIYVFEPSATVDIKLASLGRFGLGGAYRNVGNVDVPGLRAADLSGFTGFVRVRVGRF
jgi:hypothetical protein